MGVAKIKRRVGLYGDFLVRYLTWGVRNTPFYLEPVIIGLYVTIFFLVARNQRRAMMANLSVVRETDSRLILWASAYRVVWNFACTLADAARARDGESFDWEVVGVEHLEDASRKDGRGLIIMTAHMGNYDVAAPLFGSRFGRVIHAVRAPEQSEELQDLMERELAKSSSEHFRVIYNRGDGMLGVDLMRVLAGGDVVAIQGDRVMFAVTPTTIPFRPGWLLRIPMGPLTLAQASRARVLPLFVIRSARRRYKVVIHEPRDVGSASREDREAEAAALRAKWGHCLNEVIRREWRQWFVFESAFVREVNGDGNWKARR